MAAAMHVYYSPKHIVEEISQLIAGLDDFTKEHICICTFYVPGSDIVDHTDDCLIPEMLREIRILENVPLCIQQQGIEGGENPLWELIHQDSKKVRWGVKETDRRKELKEKCHKLVDWFKFCYSEQAQITARFQHLAQPDQMHGEGVSSLEVASGRNDHLAACMTDMIQAVYRVRQLLKKEGLYNVKTRKATEKAQTETEVRNLADRKSVV